MARQAETGGSAGAPFAKFNELGDRLIGAFGGGKNRQQQDFETKALKHKDDGKPKLEEVDHFIVMPGTTAFTGSPDDRRALEPGTHVRYAFDGFKWKNVIDARKELPPYAGFAAGVSCSGDVYTIELVGWSAETKNADAARKANFTVVEGRVIMRSQDEKERYVLAQLRSGGNTNPAKDLQITIRRPNPDEKAWEQKADALFDTKPWEQQAGAEREPAMAGGGSSSYGDDEPF